jgi:benzoate/toluate 1,2-dioxygenase reductase subunit
VDNADSGLIQGTPVAALAGEHFDDPQTTAYLCGPPPMIDAARRQLIEIGVSAEHIYAEQFVASAIERTGT